MQRSDQISQDVIKIFHNAKGSVSKNISKWTVKDNVEPDNSQPLQPTKWKNHDSPFEHIAGECETLPNESNPPIHGTNVLSTIKIPTAKLQTETETDSEQESNT